MPDHIEPEPTLAEELTPERHVAPGGWKRAVVGFAIGAVAGLAAALAMPRQEGARRRIPAEDR